MTMFFRAFANRFLMPAATIYWELLLMGTEMEAVLEWCARNSRVGGSDVTLSQHNIGVEVTL
jgi:hypothetical protein